MASPSLTPFTSASWFHGRIARKEAESRLLDSDCFDGCFLVRESTTIPCRYCISVLYGGVVSHILVAVSKDGAFYLGDLKQTFYDITDLLEHYMVSGHAIVSTNGRSVKLLVPCDLPPSPIAETEDVSLKSAFPISPHTYLIAADSSNNSDGEWPASQDIANCTSSSSWEYVASALKDIGISQSNTANNKSDIGAPCRRAMSSAATSQLHVNATDYINTKEHMHVIAGNVNAPILLGQGKDYFEDEVMANSSSSCPGSTSSTRRVIRSESNNSASSADSGLGTSSHSAPVSPTDAKFGSGSLESIDGKPSLRRRITQTLVAAPQAGARRVWEKMTNRCMSMSAESSNARKEYCELREQQRKCGNGNHSADSHGKHHNRRHSEQQMYPGRQCVHMQMAAETADMVHVQPSGSKARRLDRTMSTPTGRIYSPVGSNSAEMLDSTVDSNRLCLICQHSFALHEERHAMAHRHRSGCCNSSNNQQGFNMAAPNANVTKPQEAMKASDMVAILNGLRI